MSEICCICLKKSIFFQCITECVFGKVNYIEKLNVCVPNELWDESFNICNDCVDKLDGAYNFIQLCLHTQEWRKEQMTLIGLKNSLSIRPKEESATGFTCYQCSKSFRLKSTLSIHITKIHTRSKKYTKGKSQEVKSESVINNELKKDEKQLDICLGDKGNLEIPEDKLEIKYEETYKLENEEENNDSSSYEVFDHDHTYLSEEETKEKKSSKGKKRGPPTKGPFTCDACNLVFNRPYKLKHHVRAKHTFERPFKCELCDAKYLKRDSLNVHMRKHNNEKPFICSTCGKGFVTSSDITRHNKTHEEVRQYGCTDCDKSFKTKSNLRTHKLQMHQDPGMWKFICTVCGKRFPLNDALVKHMRRHEGIKDFACHLCNKKFTENGELRRHLLSHSDERNFKCNLCEKAYKKKEILNIHLKRDHGIGNCVIRQPEKKFACPLCPKVFAVNHKLKRHFLTHTGEKPVTCEFCEKRFRDNYDRNVHLRKDHNVEPKTLMCGV